MIDKLLPYKPCLNIVFCTINEHIHSLFNVVISVLRRNSRYAIRLHIIVDDSVDVDSYTGLFRSTFPNIEIIFYQVSCKLEEYNDQRHIKKETLLRLYIPDLITRNIINVVYLDPKVIVNCDLFVELSCVIFNDTGIAMKNANCCVMFMNLETLRTNGFSERCLNLFKKHPKMHIHYIIQTYCNGNDSKITNLNIVSNPNDILLHNSRHNFIINLSINARRNEYLWNRNSLETYRSKTKINIGILHYFHDEYKHASTNIGDYIQSIATINYCKKFIENKFNKQFDSFETFLSCVLDNSIDEVNFVFISRDNIDKLENYYGYHRIYLIMNGWWLHPTNNQILFNIPNNIIPLFISFHISQKKLLEPPFLNIFKKYEPIGCRDESTMALLNNHGIDTYFSGCLTIGIDFFDWNIVDDNMKKHIYYVDVKHNTPNKTLSHESKLYKNINYKKGLSIAYSLLKTYSTAAQVITSRLHCFLPCLAMNVPVSLTSPTNNKNTLDWGPPNRFHGLVNIINHENKKRYIDLHMKTIFSFLQNNFN